MIISWEVEMEHYLPTLSASPKYKMSWLREHFSSLNITSHVQAKQRMIARDDRDWRTKEQRESKEARICRDLELLRNSGILSLLSLFRSVCTCLWEIRKNEIG